MLRLAGLLDKTFGNFDRVARLKVRLLNGLSRFETRGGALIDYNGVAFSIELLE